MFKVTMRKYFRDNEYFFGYNYDKPIRMTIIHDKLSECMNAVSDERMLNELDKYSPWEIVDVVDLSEAD